MRERQEGRYYGLGITIQVDRRRHHRAVVFEGRRPTRQGIRRGDVIAQIDGEDAKGWTTEQAVQEAAGPEGHDRQHLRSSARGYDELIDMDVERDEVNIPTVPRALHDRRDDRLHPAAGLRREHRPRLGDALQELSAKGMKRLLFDMRDNPGGPLDQAIKVVERVPAARRHDRLHARPRAELRSGLPRDRRQRVHRHADGRAGQPQQRERVGDRHAARCRITTARYVVGETTFGKALVQSVYRISGGAGLALTTGALLHAERPADSASVGRQLRRVPRPTRCAIRTPNKRAQRRAT